MRTVYNKMIILWLYFLTINTLLPGDLRFPQIIISTASSSTTILGQESFVFLKITEGPKET